MSLKLLRPVRFALFVTILCVSALAAAKPPAASKTTPQGTPNVTLSSLTYTEIAGNGDSNIDPGETYRINLLLANSGDATATGIVATLTKTSPYVTLLNASSPYVDISQGGTANSTAGLVFKTDPTTPCGAHVQIDIAVTYDGGGELGTSPTILLGALALGPVETITSPDVPNAIPDNDLTGINAHVTFPGSFETVNSISVELSATHTYDQDLIFKLTSPDGTTINLIYQNGGTGDNFTNTVLSDSAAPFISSGIAPFTGSYKPITPLSAFTDQHVAGVWTLTVIDDNALDTGSLTAFSVSITPNVPACSVHAAPTAPGLAPILHVKVKTESTIPVAGSIMYSYLWSSSGPDAAVSHPATFSLDDFLSEDSGATFDVGETWSCLVTPQFNGTGGTPSTAKFIITADGVVFGGWMTN